MIPNINLNELYARMRQSASKAEAATPASDPTLTAYIAGLERQQTRGAGTATMRDSDILATFRASSFGDPIFDVFKCLGGKAGSTAT